VIEKDVEAHCDDLVAHHGGRVVRYSQARASGQSEGIADREYYVLGVKVRYEVKRAAGKLSAEQLELLTLEYGAGGIVCVGGLLELKHLLCALRRSREEGRELGKLFTDLWAARGVRGRKKQR